FQAEDGIRDKLVTGVQTCALPISHVTVSALACRWAGVVGTRVSRVQKNGKLRTDRFEGDGTPEKAPRAAAGPAAAAAGDPHRRPGRRRDDPLLRKPLLAGARAGNRACRGRPGRRGVAGGRKAAACPNRRCGRREPFVRACERTPRGRADSPKATGGSHRV